MWSWGRDETAVVLSDNQRRLGLGALPEPARCASLSVSVERLLAFMRPPAFVSRSFIGSACVAFLAVAAPREV